MSNRYKSKRYRVSSKMVDNSSPPPTQSLKYVIFDREKMVEIPTHFDTESEATEECHKLNTLTPT